MGATGSKGGAASNNTRAIYEQQQADLARQKAQAAAEENAARQAEIARRDELRRQMLGNRDVLSGDTGQGVAGAAVQKTVLG